MRRLVYIEWRDPFDDWHWFWLLDLHGDWVRLQGADYPDGSAKHEGTRFWVHRSEIEAIEEFDDGTGFDSRVVDSGRRGR